MKNKLPVTSEVPPETNVLLLAGLPQVLSAGFLLRREGKLIPM